MEIHVCFIGHFSGDAHFGSEATAWTTAQVRESWQHTQKIGDSPTEHHSRVQPEKQELDQRRRWGLESGLPGREHEQLCQSRGSSSEKIVGKQLFIGNEIEIHEETGDV